MHIYTLIHIYNRTLLLNLRYDKKKVFSCRFEELIYDVIHLYIYIKLNSQKNLL